VFRHRHGSTMDVFLCRGTTIHQAAATTWHGVVAPPGCSPVASLTESASASHANRGCRPSLSGLSSAQANHHEVGLAAKRRLGTIGSNHVCCSERGMLVEMQSRLVGEARHFEIRAEAAGTGSEKRTSRGRRGAFPDHTRPSYSRRGCFEPSSELL
jgi:hypothetical protein